MQRTFASPSFVEKLMQGFDILDEKRAGQLDPNELAPLIAGITTDHPLVVTPDHCRRLARAFDRDGKGAITRDEYVEFVKFVVAMRWMEEQEAVAKVETQLNEDKLDTHRYVAELSGMLPEWLTSLLASQEFADSCSAAFAAAAKPVTPLVAAPVISRLVTQSGFTASDNACHSMAASFERSEDAFSERDFVELAKFAVVTCCLEASEGKSDNFMAPLLAAAQLEDVKRQQEDVARKMSELTIQQTRLNSLREHLEDSIGLVPSADEALEPETGADSPRSRDLRCFAEDTSLKEYMVDAIARVLDDKPQDVLGFLAAHFQKLSEETPRRTGQACLGGKRG
mmetsp:Transcript_56537/g.150694  ORF Transcript_56537/g.150694 Transcript_56537/m.150694 type:complete len:340 (-) Transcript_56537:123-1142(-)